MRYTDKTILALRFVEDMWMAINKASTNVIKRYKAKLKI